MNTHTRHFLLTPEGQICEFSGEVAAEVASGQGKLPEFAQRRLRYLQVSVSDASLDDAGHGSEEELQVITAAANVRFDAEGRLTEAGPINEKTGSISQFEHEAVVQWALRELPTAPQTVH